MKRTIFDFHAHVFSDELAERALCSLLKDPGERERARTTCGARADMTQSYLRSLGCVGACAMNIATKAGQQTVINDWAAHTLNRDFYTPFGTVYVNAPDCIEELRRVKALGLPGIKLHPSYQHFDMREDAFFRVCEEIRALDLLLLVHCGEERGRPGVIPGHPRDLMEVARALPGLKLVIAHFGCQRRWDIAQEYVIGQPVYIDTSHTLGMLSKKTAEQMILAHDPDKILYGSDTPLLDAGQMIQFMESLSIPEPLKDKIFYHNAMRLLGKLDK